MSEAPVEERQTSLPHLSLWNAQITPSGASADFFVMIFWVMIERRFCLECTRSCLLKPFFPSLEELPIIIIQFLIIFNFYYYSFFPAWRSSASTIFPLATWSCRCVSTCERRQRKEWRERETHTHTQEVCKLDQAPDGLTVILGVSYLKAPTHTHTHKRTQAHTHTHTHTHARAHAHTQQ